MTERMGSSVTAFGFCSRGGALMQNEQITCWPAAHEDGRTGLLWRVRLSGEDARGAAGRLPDALPQGVLRPLQTELRDYLMDSRVKDLYLLTGKARPLRLAWPGGLADNTRVLQLCGALCDTLAACGAAGCLFGAADPDTVLLDEQGRPVLMPWTPAAPAARPEGFCPAPGADPARRQVYSIGMLAYWLLNGGSLPFAEEAAVAADAERRRLDGEALPAARDADPRVMELIAEACRPAGSWDLADLGQAIGAVLQPEEAARAARQRQQAEEDERRRQEREDLEEDLRQARQERERQAEKERRRSERDPGTDAGDRRLLAGIALLLAAAMAGLIFFLAGRSGTKVRSYLKEGRYATALDVLEEYRTAGKNVDELVDEFVDQCLARGEYVRAAAAYDCYAEGALPDPERTGRLVGAMTAEGDLYRAERFLKALAGRDEACADLAGQLYEEHLEEE